MKWLIVAAASLAVVSCASLSLEDLEFHAWRLKFGKIYHTPEEEAWRKNIWLSTRRRVLAHNILADQGIKTYRMGMNHFSDMTEKEYRHTHIKSWKPSELKRIAQIHNITSEKKGGAKLPLTVDWRKKGCVTHVRHQKKCGSCWAFSAAGALESHTCIKHKRLPVLSVQQLVDCSRSYENKGCDGGHVDDAFSYAMHNQGIVTEKAYPYRAKKSQCRFGKKIPTEMIHARCLYFVRVAEGDEIALQASVALAGPVSVHVDASQPSFDQYKTGVYDEPLCGNTIYNITHAMLVVGYGTENGRDYWLVKNSHGSSWGDQGYIKMARNKNNQCAIASFAFYPIVW